jgi:hypothetical protein
MLSPHVRRQLQTRRETACVVYFGSCKSIAASPPFLTQRENVNFMHACDALDHPQQTGDHAAFSAAVDPARHDDGHLHRDPATAS